MPSLSQITLSQQRVFKLLLNGALLHLRTNIDKREAKLVDHNNNVLEVSLKTFVAMSEQGFLISYEEPKIISEYLNEIYVLTEKGKELAEELKVEVDINNIKTSGRGVILYSAIVNTNRKNGELKVIVESFKGTIRGHNCHLRSRTNFFNGRIQIKIEEICETPKAALEALLVTTNKERKSILDSLEFNGKAIKVIREKLISHNESEQSLSLKMVA